MINTKELFENIQIQILTENIIEIFHVTFG